MTRNIKLLPMSKVAAAGGGTRSHKPILRDSRAFDILQEAENAWNNMARFRRDRERNKRYTYGDQWQDVIRVDGCKMTEEEYIRRQGNEPLKNNVIRRQVDTILGVYRAQEKEPTCVARDRDEQQYGETMSTVLQCNMQLNRMNDMLARGMEEFLISGMAVVRKWYGWRRGKRDCWTDYVQPNNFFVDANMRDFRGWDVGLVGEIHDVSFEELCAQFATTPAEWQHLKDIYSMQNGHAGYNDYVQQFGYGMSHSSFLFPDDDSRCRVLEVWRRENKARYRCHDWNSGELFKVNPEDYAEEVEAENKRRLAQAKEMGMDQDNVPLVDAEWCVDECWTYYYLTPFGDILAEGETPYEHGEHPYVFKAYPYIDGEVHSYVSNIIDQQRYINRLITMYDWTMRASAKGLLMFPEDCLPKDMTLDEVADEWGRFNGMIVIRKGATQLPQQIANRAVDIGITELLQIQLKLIEDIGGANGALQGKQGYSGMSAALYNQQTQNATTSLLDILETFDDFVKEGAFKDVKNIQQFYDEKRVFNIAGRSGVLINYDPQMIRDVEFDLSITDSTKTPAYRQLANDFLMQIWQSGQITIEQLLEHGDFPFADQLLQSIQSQKEEMQQQQLAQPEQLQQMQQPTQQQQ